MAQDLFAPQPGSRSDLLVKCGFIKKGKEANYQFNVESKEYEPVSGYIFNPKDADEEEKETIRGLYNKTGFPRPRKFYNLMWEVFDLSMEEPYFWILDVLKENFPEIIKLEDSFAAAENSAFFGVTQQRLGAQQDKVSQFLATTGKMIKELFQMVRELRIIDERLEYYKNAEEETKKPLAQRKKGDEITLKGFFVDLVQGGGKSAASVYGMARELEFITLPDLFFDAPPFRDRTELEEHVNNLGKNFNQNVLRVLLRHLVQYMEWRKRTAQEHLNRRRFQLAYLKQHFDIIKMYINWVRPYLRHVARLHMKEQNMTSADLVSAFEGSMLDIELLARNPGSRKGVNGCILATFNYRTRPELKVVQEGYQRGPVHIGRFEMNLRVYGWTDEQIKNYRELKNKETLFLMGEVSSSVHAAMESLGKELEVYYREAEGKTTEARPQKSSEPLNKSFMEKFLGDFYTPQKAGTKPTKSRKQAKADTAAQNEEIEKLVGIAKGTAWGCFHNFKKAHRLVAW